MKADGRSSLNQTFQASICPYGGQRLRWLSRLVSPPCDRWSRQPDGRSEESDHGLPGNIWEYNSWPENAPSNTDWTKIWEFTSFWD